MPRPQNFVSAFVDINVCPSPFFGKIFTKSTDKNRVGPPLPIIDGEGDCGKGNCGKADCGKDDCVGSVNGYHFEDPQNWC